MLELEILYVFLTTVYVQYAYKLYFFENLNFPRNFIKLPTASHAFIGVTRRFTGCTCTPREEKKNAGQIYRGKL